MSSHSPLYALFANVLRFRVILYFEFFLIFGNCTFDQYYDYRESSSQLRNSFGELKADYITNAHELSDILRAQNDIISIIEISAGYLDHLQYSQPKNHNWVYSRNFEESHYEHYSYAHEIENNFDPKIGTTIFSDRLSKPKINLDIHINVVFIGFPLSAIKMIKHNWLDNLGHKYEFIVKLGSFGDIVSLHALDPDAEDATTISYHFHLIQISFQVADVIKKRINLLANASIKSSQNSFKMLNSWEMENILDNLTEVLTSASLPPHAPNEQHTTVESIPTKATSTLFFLNIAHTSDYYSYISGFPSDDIKNMAEDVEIIDLCEKVIKDEQAMLTSKVTKQWSQSKPLHETVEEIIREQVLHVDTDADGEHHRSSRHRYGSYDGSGVGNSAHESGLRDAVSSTKQWAIAFDEETNKLMSSNFTLKSQVLRILNSRSDTAQSPVLASYRVELASSILQAAEMTNANSNASVHPRFKINHQRKSAGSASKISLDTSASVPRSFGTWVGRRSNIIWKDINANTGAHSQGQSLAMSPRPLTEMEMLKIGEQGLRRDFTHDIEFLDSVILRQEKTTRELFLEAQCDMWLPEDLKHFVDADPNEITPQFIETVVKYLFQYESEYIFDSCSFLSFELIFLRSISTTKSKLFSIYSSNETKDNPEYSSDFIRDSSQLLVRTLTTAIEYLNKELNALPKIKSETGETHISTMSKEAVMYLSSLTGNVLDITRYLIAPPMEIQQSIHMFRSPESGLHLMKSDLIGGANDVKSLLTPRLREFIAQNGEINKKSVSNHGEWQSLQGVVMNSFHNANSRHKKDTKGCAADKDIDGLARHTNRLHDLVHLSLAYPTILTPTKLEFVVYVVKAQQVFDPLNTYLGDDSGFDYFSFKSEISRLALPNQEFTVVAHVIDAHEESELSMALQICRRQTTLPGLSSTDKDVSQRSKSQTALYLNARCILSHVEHYDEESEKIDDLKNLDSKSFGDNGYKYSLHVPIFLISLDSSTPIYLDGSKQVTSFGNSILIVQNSQLQLPTPLSSSSHSLCDAEHLDLCSISGRNPLRAALAEVGKTLGGLPLSHFGHKGTQTTLAKVSQIFDLENELYFQNGPEGSRSFAKCEVCSAEILKSTAGRSGITLDPSSLHDWTKGHGDSPTFEASYAQIPRYSSLEIDFMHRSRILRTVSVANALAHEEIVSFKANAKAKLLEDSNSDFITADFHSIDDILSEYEEKINNLIEITLQLATNKDWEKAAAHANALYFTVLNADKLLTLTNESEIPAVDANRGKPFHNPKKDKSSGRKPKSKSFVDSIVPWFRGPIAMIAFVFIIPFTSGLIFFAIANAVVTTSSKNWKPLFFHINNLLTRMRKPQAPTSASSSSPNRSNNFIDGGLI